MYRQTEMLNRYVLDIPSGYKLAVNGWVICIRSESETPQQLADYVFRVRLQVDVLG